MYTEDLVIQWTRAQFGRVPELSQQRARAKVAKLDALVLEISLGSPSIL